MLTVGRPSGVLGSRGRREWGGGKGGGVRGLDDVGFQQISRTAQDILTIQWN